MNATATCSSISLCKLFASKMCVNQDGVPWTNPVLATPEKVSVNTLLQRSGLNVMCGKSRIGPARNLQLVLSYRW